MSTENTVKWLISVVCGVIAALFDRYGLFIFLVAASIVFDFVTGIIKSIVCGKGLDSEKAYKGFWKKVSLFVALAFGIFLDYIAAHLLLQIDIELAASTPFALIIASYIVVNECISIVENLYLINPNSMPKSIAKLLKVAKSGIEGKVGGDTSENETDTAAPTGCSDSENEVGEDDADFNSQT